MRLLNDFSNKRFGLNLRPEFLLSLAAVWCYLLNRTALPCSALVHLLLVTLFIVSVGWAYRSFSFELGITGSDCIFFFVVLLLNLCFHWSTIFFSLGGDELYHAERAHFVLSTLGTSILSTAQLSNQEYRASIWNLFDPGFMAVIDLWRVLSILLLLIVTALVWIYFRYCKQPGKEYRSMLAGLGLVFLFYLLGNGFSLPADNHPPLRLLPLFLSSLMLGLNSFAFRFPGTVVVSVLALFIYKLLERTFDQKADWFRVLIALLPGFIPVIFYVAEAVEPSVFGFAVYTAVLLLCVAYLERKHFELLVWAAVIAGIGTVLRQSTLVVWLPIGVLFLLGKHFLQVAKIPQLALPALLGLPYLYTASKLGHTATQNTLGLWEAIRTSLTSGIGPMSVLNTTTLAWVIVVCLIMIYLCYSAKLSELLLFLTIVPAYIMFYMIWPYLWGVGRYQAEYVAPFISLALFLFGKYAGPELRRLSVPILIALVATTLEVNSNLSLDTNYLEWPKMRITTSANFPYREALGSLKRMESDGNFALLGGSPWYGSMVTWLSGFSFKESAHWKEHQNRFDAFIAAGERSASDIRQFLEKHRIRYLVVQSGTRRELQHRNPGVSTAVGALEAAVSGIGRDFSILARYEGEHGGALTIYLTIPQS